MRSHLRVPRCKANELLKVLTCSRAPISTHRSVYGDHVRRSSRARHRSECRYGVGNRAGFVTAGAAVELADINEAASREQAERLVAEGHQVMALAVESPTGTRSPPWLTERSLPSAA